MGWFRLAVAAAQTTRTYTHTYIPPKYESTKVAKLLLPEPACSCLLLLLKERDQAAVCPSCCCCWQCFLSFSLPWPGLLLGAASSSSSSLRVVSDQAASSCTYILGEGLLRRLASSHVACMDFFCSVYAWSLAVSCCVVRVD